MYEFILLQFKLHRINEEQVRAFVPRYLTTEQAKTIINGTDA